MYFRLFASVNRFLSIYYTSGVSWVELGVSEVQLGVAEVQLGVAEVELGAAVVEAGVPGFASVLHLLVDSVLTLYFV